MNKETQMNIQRARQIAASFSRVTELHVEELSGGLLVQHHGKSCYFLRESCFWPFAFKVAGTARADVADIELKLVA